jgi:succinate dehydrogenase/fumarate reductase flavoprotein subunit
VANRTQAWDARRAAPAVAQIRELGEGRNGEHNATRQLAELRKLMWEDVGPFRDAAGMARAIARLTELRGALRHAAIAPGGAFNPTLTDWFDLRGSLIAAEAVARAALARTESRGAHQREDFPETIPSWAQRQHVSMQADGTLAVEAAA